MLGFKKKEENEETVDTTVFDGSVKEQEEPTKITTHDEPNTDPPPLTYKEAKALKRSRYDKDIANNPKFKHAYVIQNKKTGQIVEIRAASAVHASNIIGWKPKRVKLLDVRCLEKHPEPETSASSSHPKLEQSIAE